MTNRHSSSPHEMSQTKKLSSAFASSVGLFIATTLLAYWLNWDIVDIAWSIWTTTLAVSVLTVFVESIFMYWLLEVDEVTPEQKANPNYKPSSTESNIFSVLFMFGIQMYLVLGVSLVVGLTLDDLLPIKNADAGLSMIEIAVLAISSYWPFLLISLIQPCIFYYKICKQEKYKDQDTQIDILFAPYYFVFKNQALTLILLALSYFSSQYLVYWVLLLFYFFPWSELWELLKSSWQKKRAEKDKKNQHSVMLE